MSASGSRLSCGRPMFRSHRVRSAAGGTRVWMSERTDNLQSNIAREFEQAARVPELETSLNAAREANTRLQAQVEALENELGRTKQLASRVAELTSQLHSSREETAALRREINSLATDQGLVRDADQQH